MNGARQMIEFAQDHDVHPSEWNCRIQCSREKKPAGDRPGHHETADMLICELYPRLAKMADKFVVIRSLVGSNGR